MRGVTLSGRVPFALISPLPRHLRSQPPLSRHQLAGTAEDQTLLRAFRMVLEDQQGYITLRCIYVETLASTDNNYVSV